MTSSFALSLCLIKYDVLGELINGSDAGWKEWERTFVSTCLENVSVTIIYCFVIGSFILVFGRRIQVYPIQHRTTGQLPLKTTTDQSHHFPCGLQKQCFSSVSSSGD
ncbi:hypothetical protein V6N11_041962 [Hibiscus sabdariffa]|uniref:Uncharacterized protein n=1 Tax=Hibiscus sabdariffa TaxID=183260 RepID=A0ABR2QVK3_9ROSI